MGENIDIASAPPIGAFKKHLDMIREGSPEQADQRERESRRWLAVNCPTCGAAPGEWCIKTRNVQRGGASHLTRVDRAYHEESRK